MTDEEKKAIETLTNKRPSEQMLISGKMCVNVLINLIEKQSKEIEELKKYEKYYEEMEEVNKKFIAVDKIKAKIEELDYNDIGNFERRCKQEVLQSLLEKE